MRQIENQIFRPLAKGGKLKFVKKTGYIPFSEFVTLPDMQFFQILRNRRYLNIFIEIDIFPSEHSSF